MGIRNGQRCDPTCGSFTSKSVNAQTKLSKNLILIKNQKRTTKLWHFYVWACNVTFYNSCNDNYTRWLFALCKRYISILRKIKLVLRKLRHPLAICSRRRSRSLVRPSSRRTCGCNLVASASSSWSPSLPVNATCVSNIVLEWEKNKLISIK